MYNKLSRFSCFGVISEFCSSVSSPMLTASHEAGAQPPPPLGNWITSNPSPPQLLLSLFNTFSLLSCRLTPQQVAPQRITSNYTLKLGLQLFLHSCLALTAGSSFSLVFSFSQKCSRDRNTLHTSAPLAISLSFFLLHSNLKGQSWSFEEFHFFFKLLWHFKQHSMLKSHGFN